MILEKNFIKKLNKARVLNAVKSYYPSPSYEELSSIYDSMLNLLFKNTYPLGVYKIEKKPKTINYNLLKDYDYLVYCLVTIGDETEYIIDNFFDENQFTHAIVLDAMASSLLFEISSQLFNSIHDYVKALGMGLSCKIAPGDGEIELEYQREIVNILSHSNEHDIHLVDNYMLSPSKSMSYIYGADKSVEPNSIDHNCNNCYNNYCSMRNISEEIRNPF